MRVRVKKYYEDEFTKECSGCFDFLPLENFRKRIQKDRLIIVAKCKRCEYERNKATVNMELKRETERIRLSNPENKKRKNEYGKEWRNKNIEKNREYHKKHIKKHVDEISDLYVIRTLTRGKKGDLPEDLIDAKRTQLLLKRTIKQLQNAKK